MIVKPTVVDLLKNVDNRFQLVIAVSKRARQIANGSKLLTGVDEESPVTLAANEIAEGKVYALYERIYESDCKRGHGGQQKQREPFAYGAAEHIAVHGQTVPLFRLFLFHTDLLYIKRNKASRLIFDYT